MEVCFYPEVIYKNAFYLSQSKRLYKREIVRFCGFLKAEITKNPNYPHVYFVDFSQWDIEQFYKQFWGVFHEIGSSIYLCREINETDIKSVNSDYDEFIKLCLERTSQKFLLLNN